MSNEQNLGRAVVVAPNRTLATVTYVQAIHPEHGEPVTFIAGERLPAWVVEAITADRKDEHGRYLAAPPGNGGGEP